MWEVTKRCEGDRAREKQKRKRKRKCGAKRKAKKAPEENKK